MKKITLFFLLLVSVYTFAIDTYYVRPTGDVTSWSTQATADPAQVLTITDISELTPYLGVSKIFNLAKGTYTAKLVDETTLISGYYLQLANGEKIQGGFSGMETIIDLTSRALIDRDGNGSIEAWEFSNETLIDGQAGTTLGAQSKRLFGIENNSEVNGISIKNFSFQSITIGANAGGPIYVGSFLKTNDGSVSTAPVGYDATTSGNLLNCYIFNLSAYSPIGTPFGGEGGAAIISNINSIVNNCLFEQCQSNTYNSSVGGAVYVLGTGGQIKNSIFRNNKTYFTFGSGTNSKGGAVFGEAYTASDMNLIIENSVFYNNSSFAIRANYGYGGAFRNDAVAGKRGAQIINCTFSNNYNTVTTSGNVELINTGTLVNCINYGGSKGFRANTANANYFLANCISTVANLDMAANATSYPTVTFNAATDFGFARTTSFNGAVFPADVDYATKIVEIRKANFSSSKAGSYLASNYGVASLPASYTASTGPSTVNITATLPANDIKGLSRNLAQNTIGAYNFISDAVAPTAAISSTVAANATTSLSSIPFTITFSEPVNGFDLSDIVVTNGTAADFVVVNSEVFTFNVAPVAVGPVTVNVSSSIATDFAGISNSAATEYSVVSDFGTNVTKNGFVAANVFATNGSLVFQNCTNQSVSIFTADAKLIKRFTIGTETEKMSLSSGLYIVKVNNKFFKVVNR